MKHEKRITQSTPERRGISHTYTHNRDHPVNPVNNVPVAFVTVTDKESMLRRNQPLNPVGDLNPWTAIGIKFSFKK